MKTKLGRQWMMLVLSASLLGSGNNLLAEEKKPSDVLKEEIPTPEEVGANWEQARKLCEHPRLEEILEKRPDLVHALMKHRTAAVELAQHPHAHRVLDRHGELREWVEDHPEAARAFWRHPGFGEFALKHPEAARRMALHRERIREKRFHTIEEKKTVRPLPIVRPLPMERRPEWPGVRDLGRGEGREGVGQGGEHRSPEARPAFTRDRPKKDRGW